MKNIDINWEDFLKDLHEDVNALRRAYEDKTMSWQERGIDLRTLLTVILDILSLLRFLHNLWVNLIMIFIK